MAFDEHALECREHVGAVAKPDHLQRFQRIDGGTGADRQAGRAQGARKADDVVGDEATSMRFCDAVRHSDYFDLPASAVSSVFARVSPCMRVMSSLYFKSAPSESPTTCGVSDFASNSRKAVAQSSVSAMPGGLNRSSSRTACTKATTCSESLVEMPETRDLTIATSRSADG